MLKRIKLILNLWRVVPLWWLCHISKTWMMIHADLKRWKEIDKKASEAGILKSEIADNKQYTFYGLRYSDPKLALAGLRIEIESVLRKIAEANQLDTSRTGIGQMAKVLRQHQLINDNERAIIFDLVGILNKAVHNQLKEYESESFDWVFDLGLNLLKSLNAKLS